MSEEWTGDPLDCVSVDAADRAVKEARKDERARLLRELTTNRAAIEKAAKQIDAYVPLPAGAYTVMGEAFVDAVNAAWPLAPEGEDGGRYDKDADADTADRKSAITAAPPSPEQAREGEPTYGDLLEALDAAGCELTDFEECPHQGTHIRWTRPPREGESFLGLPVANPLVGEVVERHYAPFDEIPASPELMRVTGKRAIQRAIWALDADRPSPAHEEGSA